MNAPTAPDAPSRRRLPLAAQIFGAMALGLGAGALLGEKGTALGEVGALVIQVIKAAATPLLFFAIVNAVARTEVSAKDGGRLVLVATFNAAIALGIGLTLSNVLQPGRYLAMHAPDLSAADKYRGYSIDFVQAFTGHVPTSVVKPFVDNAVLGVVMLALLFGFGLRKVLRGAAETDAPWALARGAEAMQQVLEVSLGWIVRLIPLAVFAVVARTVGQYGFRPFLGLGAYLGVGLLGLFLHAVITHHSWVRFYAKMPLRRFWAAASEPVVTALGTNSSLATLPVTLRALDTLGVSRRASALGACVGTNLNNDGIILYEGMAVLFVAQASGLDLSLSQQLLAAAACMVAAMGVAGVPEAGFVSLALVLNTVKLPIEVLPLLLTVDWVIARGRSVVNTLADMVLSIILDRMARHDAPGEQVAARAAAD